MVRTRADSEPPETEVAADSPRYPRTGAAVAPDAGGARIALSDSRQSNAAPPAAMAIASASLGASRSSFGFAVVRRIIASARAKRLLAPTLRDADGICGQRAHGCVSPRGPRIHPNLRKRALRRRPLRNPSPPQSARADPSNTSPRVSCCATPNVTPELECANLEVP